MRLGPSGCKPAGLIAVSAGIYPLAALIGKPAEEPRGRLVVLTENGQVAYTLAVGQLATVGGPGEGMHQFEATVDQAGGSRPWLFIRIPSPVSDALGSRTRMQVKGQVNGWSFESMLFVNPDDGHFQMLNQSLKKGTKAVAGSAVRVKFEPT